MFAIEPAVAYRADIDRLIAGNWAGPMVVSRGVLHDTRPLPAAFPATFFTKL